VGPFIQRPKPAQQQWASSIEFVGEQDGPLERSLKAELREIIARRPLVDSAYLARAVYGEIREPQVVLVLGSDMQDRALVEEIGLLIFKRLPDSEHLDIFFASHEQELQLAAVCKPFFKRSVSDGDH
jgi:hypothetical protein